MDRMLTISEAARALGCSVEWLRSAEHLDRIPKARRDINGWRRYSFNDVEVLKEVLFPSNRKALNN